MSDLEASRTVRPYVPFPSFTTWAGGSRVNALVDRYSARYSDLRSRSSDEAAAMRERATRWAAIDTGAIEGLYDVDRGFTISVAANVALLEAVRAVKGEAVERAVEDALAAYEYVLDLATRREAVTEVAIRELHTVVCRSQATYRVVTAVGPQEQPLPKGTYKTQENHPLNLATNEVHSYASVADTAPEMARLIDELQSEAFLEAHPVLQASYAHYAFVAVHPFADGNGRVSRAIGSVYLYRDPGLPLVVFDDEKPDYFRALEAADDGEIQRFVAFVGERLIDTVNLLFSAQGPALPTPGETAAKFAQELSGRGGRSHEEVDAAAERLLEAFHRHLTAALTEAALVAPLSGAVQILQALGIAVPEGFRPPPQGRSVYLRLSSAAPPEAQIQEAVSVVIARGVDDQVDLMVVSAGGASLEVFLREVVPRISFGLDLRLEEFAQRLLRSQLERVTEAAKRTLQEKGYR